MIEKKFVINLKIRPDRLQQFYTFLPEKLGEVEVVRAVHGDSCPHPSWWNAGSGAWGCYRSHLQILERVMSEDIQNYMVLEDDCMFSEDFDSRYDLFINDLPPDWDMFYLGGQLMHGESNSPQKITDNVYRPYNVNRTHCFAVNKKGYKYLYDFLLRRFESRQWHIDHHLGRLHEQGEFNVYCPPEWLVGQEEGSSNIGSENHRRMFPHPITYFREPSIANLNKCVVLRCPELIARELVKLHKWHCGYDLDYNFIDKGLRDLSSYPAPKLRHWWYYIRKEAVEGNKTPFLWIPQSFSDELYPFIPIKVQGNSCNEIIEKLKLVTL